MAGRGVPAGPELPAAVETYGPLPSCALRLLAAALAETVAGAGPRPAPSRPPGGTGPAAAPTGTPPASSARPVLVRFEVTGDGPLASLGYAVNGRFTTLHDVPLTWRKSVPVARRQGRVDWRSRLTAPTPAVRCQVRVDGAEQWHGPHLIRPLTGPAPYLMDVSGSVVSRDPSPSLLPRVGAVDEEGLTP
ncbi:hypothetical protein [Streptomyces buecherae]|uniref:Uncharacterized protein n=1 Tax=Streptomyces buecherae TaxID=2763006 RepID=A0A7H8NIZ5_9ACTN|nr:hypothetical protein [Streptomyces buecherae]QKW53368.1 hypothetical protein HUT08_31790 [Streptomyces buecherae]